MSDEPPGDAAHAERAELDTLRRRAYGPDADIWADAVAAARLGELEDLLRRERAARVDRGARPVESWPDATPEVPADNGSTPVARADELSPQGAMRPARRHAAFVIATAVVAALLGAAAWSQSQVAPVAAGHAKTAAIAKERRAAGYETGYRLYLDRLRDEVLSAPGAEEIAARMIREQLRPYGALYGRTVGAGPTVDGEFCMIVADETAPVVECIPIENAFANPVSIILPAGYAHSAGDPSAGAERLITYTLLPGGGVVASPTDAVAPPAP